jgi:hypothetical protein
MSRFYQKYLSGLKSKDDKSGVGKKIDPTSMAPSARITSNSSGKGAFKRPLGGLVLRFLDCAWFLFKNSGS